MCCGDYLAEVVSREARLTHPPLVVGDAVEEFALGPRTDDPNAAFRILWFGSHGSPNAVAGMEDLRRIRTHLAAAAKQRACELVIVSNKRETYDALRGELDIPLALPAIGTSAPSPKNWARARSCRRPRDGQPLHALQIQ